MSKSYKEIMNQISTFIFDVDGVLTDGKVHVTTNGEMLRIMSIKDGYALKTAIDAGYKVVIISGGSNEGVKIRLQNLGVTDIFLGTANKVATFEDYIKNHEIKPENCLFMGDDIPDFKIMNLVGLPTCPQDAAPEIKAISKYISHIAGGNGCARDVIEQVMKVQGKWMKQFDAQYD
ncbi:HAD-IIIA family hydrolase [Flavobacterium agricola]|uniref:HAD-IIIA family hydrolase n=1 Tax=Flavobacterium agricola TaxID=2870839 RepID=A0ABY6M313_9FLAO|nr:HAD-IIIA family hydrolase [Flavobacterium agricola]UYW02190.1 HAD-IIIA family hydrolase [Flavobacterium agricola]